jgi:hypothetical protein
MDFPYEPTDPPSTLETSYELLTTTASLIPGFIFDPFPHDTVDKVYKEIICE